MFLYKNQFVDIFFFDPNRVMGINGAYFPALCQVCCKNLSRAPWGASNMLPLSWGGHKWKRSRIPDFFLRQIGKQDLRYSKQLCSWTVHHQVNCYSSSPIFRPTSIVTRWCTRPFILLFRNSFAPEPRYVSYFSFV